MHCTALRGQSQGQCRIYYTVCTYIRGRGKEQEENPREFAWTWFRFFLLLRLRKSKNRKCLFRAVLINNGYFYFYLLRDQHLHGRRHAWLFQQQQQQQQQRLGREAIIIACLKKIRKFKTYFWPVEFLRNDAISNISSTFFNVKSFGYKYQGLLPCTRYNMPGSTKKYSYRLYVLSIGK